MSISINIPNKETYEIRYLVFDLNGTLTEEGILKNHIKQQIMVLEKHCKIYILTADTNNTAKALEEEFQEKVSIHTLESNNHREEKGAFIETLGSANCIAFGNGNNDREMLRKAIIGVGVIGKEGMASSLFTTSDIVVGNMEDALGLLLRPSNLVATLRE